MIDLSIATCVNERGWINHLHGVRLHTRGNTGWLPEFAQGVVVCLLLSSDKQGHPNSRLILRVWKTKESRFGTGGVWVDVGALAFHVLETRPVRLSQTCTVLLREATGELPSKRVG